MLTLLLLACAPEPVLHDTLPVAEQLADEGVRDWPGETMLFDWIPTVWMYGLHRLHTATGDPRWQAPYRDWMDAALPDFTGDAPHAFDSSDSMSPSLLASILMLETGASTWTPITDAAAAYLDDAPRTSQGAIAHWGTDRPWGTTSQVWVDSQFMFGVFALREHERTGDTAWLDLWSEQYALFADLCRDDGTALYFHAYDDETGENIPDEPTFWARGNAWVLVSAAEMLAHVGVDDPRAEPVLPLFREHARAVSALQAPDGLWHTVLDSPRGDDPANYTETSASALIAYALVRGVASGALEPDDALPVVSRAVTGLRERIDEASDGSLVVAGTSFGTNPGDYDYYTSVGTADDLMLGIGAVVMLFAEAHGVEDPLAEAP